MSAFVWTRRRVAAAAAAGLVVVGGGTGLAIGLSGDQTPAAPPSVPSTSATSPALTGTPAPSAKPEPAPTDPLTGKKVSDQVVLAVKVENIALARPQVGLHAADIVFAEEVEGAQTRLVAVYHSTFPAAVEPVRSARSTDVQLLPLFGKPGLVYSGANARVQAMIDKASIVPIYRETRDPARAAPHNVRVNLAKLATSEKAGRARSIGWTFAADDDRVDAAPAASTAKAKVGHDTFGFAYSKGRYTVRWNGQTYRDGVDGSVTRTDNVIVLDVHNHADGNRDVLGSASVQSDTVGKGKMTLDRDGHRLTGTWERTAVDAPMRLRDSEGRDLALKPGQTWVALRG